MRRCLLPGISLACLLVAAGTAQAVPIDYTITFNRLVGSEAAPTGSFTYDADTPLFSNFHVLWNGLDFDLTAEANAPTEFSPNCGNTLTGPSLGFAIVSGATACPTEQQFAAVSFFDATSVVALFASRAPGGGDPVTTLDMRQLGGQTTRLNVQARGTFTIAAQPVSTVPEPTSIALLASGLAGVLVRRRRRKA